MVRIKTDREGRGGEGEEGTADMGDQPGKLARQDVPDRVREVDDGRTGFNDRLENSAEKIPIAP